MEGDAREMNNARLSFQSVMMSRRTLGVYCTLYAEGSTSRYIEGTRAGMIRGVRPGCIVEGGQR